MDQMNGIKKVDDVSSTFYLKYISCFNLLDSGKA